MKDIEALERAWIGKNQLEFKNLIRECYRNSPNCYQYALILMSNSSDFFKAKATGLASSIIVALKSWVNGREEKFSHLLTLEMKVLAINTVLKQKNRTLISLVCDVYHLAENSDMFVDTIRELIESKKFHEAACGIMELQMQNCFCLYDVVVPLILQDRVSVTESYIKDYPNLQLELVKYLDSLLESSSVIGQAVKKYSSVPGFRRNKLVPKTLNKLISRILKAYNIPAENCPNFCKMRNQGAMKYLIRRKYIEKNIAEDCWEEMIKEAADNNVELQKELVIETLCLGDKKCALKWANYYNLPLTEFPKVLSDASLDESNSREDEHAIDEVSWDKEWSKPFLGLRLDFCSVHIVENAEELKKSLEEITCYDIVGIDAEWKPSFGITKSRIALLQIATWDDIYLFDMLKLGDCLNVEQKNEILHEIFFNNHLLKLGYGLTSDLEMLEEFFQRGKLKIGMMMDYRTFYKELEKNYPDLLQKVVKHSSSQDKVFKGLSELTWTVLGLPLDKSEQYSDWERRPLRKAQQLYAAIDAFCLLQLYEEFGRAAVSLNLSIREIFFELSSGNQVVKKSRKSKQKASPHKPKPPNPPAEVLPVYPPTSVSDFHVVVDTMLQGLGKYLRICGCDATILENQHDHTIAAKIAMRENRIILTNGIPFEMLKKYVPEGRCFSVPNDMLPKEQAVIVFKHYNVQITEEDIFSRCTVCNGGDYIPVDNKELKSIWKRYQKHPYLDGDCNTQDMLDKRSSETESPSVWCPTIGELSGSRNSKYACSRIPLHLSQLSENALERVRNFLICSNCGKVYWYGSHFSHVKNSMVDMIEENLKKSVYDKYVTDSSI